MLENDVRNTILKYDLLQKGDHVVVGLSGGPDSVCLFSVLYELAREMELHLYAVHINHKLRPVAAEEDQAFVEELCARLGVPCHVYVRDCNRIAAELGITSEEAGRKARYEAFSETARGILTGSENLGKKIKIAVAHNMNDQAETVLFRLLRGTGIDGLSGMEYARQDESGFTIIRPLLDTSREDIERYCRQHGLNPRIDHTNAEAIYARNKIRLNLIPYLKENFNTNITEALCRLARIAREDKNYIWAQAQKAYGEALCGNGEGQESREDQRSGAVSARKKLDLEKMRAMEPAIRHRVILTAFSEIGLYKDVTAAHLAAADALIESGRTGSSTDFPRGYKLLISYGQVVACGPEMACVSPENSGPEMAGASKAAAQGKSLETEEIPDGCVWRTRMPGDYIRVKLTKEQDGQPAKYGRKKIQDYFVDKKVPREERDRIRLLCRGHEVLKVDYEFKRPPAKS